MADNEVSMMMPVYPGAMTGFSALTIRIFLWAFLWYRTEF